MWLRQPTVPCVFFSSRRRHTRFDCDWSSDVCSSDLCRGGLTPLKLNRRMLQPGFDPNRWIGSLGRQSLEIDLRNLLVEENALVGHTHRKCDREVRVNDSKVPRRGGDSGLTTGVNVVHARKFRRGSYCYTEVDATKLANGPEEFPVLVLSCVMRGTRTQTFVAGAVPASAAVVHRRIPLLEPDAEGQVHRLRRVGAAEKDRVLWLWSL